MGRYSKDELVAAHEKYLEVANRCAAAQQWREWADLFTQDAEYVEHTFGRFSGREAIFSWIQPLMQQWPNSEMNSFPHDWCVLDEERGWWICQIENRFRDPGDGSVHQASNITVLHYAGDGLFSYEEDAYNPANFGPVVTAWMEAYESNNSR
jgi:SnoaL-like domain